MRPETPKLIATLIIGPTVVQYLLTWLGMLLLDPSTTTSPFWGTIALTMVAVLRLWPGPTRSWKPLAVSSLGMAGAMALAAFQAGIDPARALIMGVGNGVAALIVAACWQRVRSEPDLAPASRKDLLRLLGLCWLAGVLAVGLGGTWPIANWSTALIWVITIATNLMTGFPGTLILFHSHQRTALTTTPKLWIFVAALPTFVCLVLPLIAPEYPLQWLVLAPFLWAGLAGTPRWIAAVSTITAVLVLVGYSTTSLQPVNAGLHSYSILELLIAFAVALSLVMVYSREETARVHQALGDLHTRQVSRNKLLNAVFAHMGDGVLVLDATGRVRFSNQSAQLLFGVTLPEKATPKTWSDAFSFTDAATGSPISRADLRVFLHPHETSTHLRVATGSTHGSPRLLSMLNHLAPLDKGAHRVILVRDTTAQTEQQQQLQAFAGSVARQLKHPLLEATDAIAEADTAVSRAQLERGRIHLGQAQHATSRMRNLIDDYLDRTVAREGAVNPEVLDLHDLVDEVVSRSEALAHAAVIVRGAHKVTSDPALTRHLMRRLLEYLASEAPREPTLNLQTRPYRTNGWVEVAVEVPTAHADAPLVTFQNAVTGFARSAPVVGLSEEPQVSGASTLAVCEAIVQRHGGQLHTGTGDAGCLRVCFTLPDA